MKIWALVRVEVTRLLRDRSNLFFVFLFPLLLIIFIGAQFGSDLSTRLGAVADPDDAAAGEVVAALEALEGWSPEEWEGGPDVLIDGDGSEERDSGAESSDAED